MKKLLILLILLVPACKWSITAWDPGEPYSGELPAYFAAGTSFSYEGQSLRLDVRARLDSLGWWTDDSDSLRSVVSVARTDSLLRILLPANEYTPNLILNGLTTYDGRRVSYYGGVYVAGSPDNLKVGQFLGTFYTWRP